MNCSIATVSAITLFSAGAFGQAINVLPTTVTPLGTPWYSDGNSGGGASGITSYTGIDGDGAALIQGDRTRFVNGFQFNSDTTPSLGLASNLTRFSYDWNVVQTGPTVATAQAPALRLILRDPTNGRRIEIVWEDGEQSSQQFVPPGGSGTLGAVYSGDFFAPGSRVYAFTAGLGRGVFDNGGLLITASAIPWSTMSTYLPSGTFITGISLGVGSSVGSFIGYADHVDFAVAGGIDTTMNFVPTPGAAAALGLGGLAAFRRRRSV